MIKNSMKRTAYSAPEISVVDYETESGFAQSFGDEGRAGKLTYDPEENDIVF